MNQWLIDGWVEGWDGWMVDRWMGGWMIDYEWRVDGWMVDGWVGG